MAAKRALIVDDSKSARAFLLRVLEKYGIEVDTAESAEQAISQLSTSRPDVIFMDHLMPGMDGFQAVQSIKNNPRTAMIPVMMYTSQEGELYLGQARALGAVGVLPKQIKPADVSKVLYQLKLLPDRRTQGQSSFEPATALDLPAASAADAANLPADSSEPARVAGTLGPEIKSLVEAAVHTQMVELRQFFTASLEDYSAGMLSDVRLTLQEALPPPRNPVAPPAASPLAWIVASAALIAALIVGVLWSHALSERAGLQQQLAATQAALNVRPAPVSAPVADEQPAPPPQVAAVADAGVAPEDVSPRPAAPEDYRAPRPSAAASPVSAPPPRSSTAVASTVIAEAVPYGEIPLSAARLESLHALFARLENEAYRGVVEIRTFRGRFCLDGNANDGYSVAPDDLPLTKCAVLGNPYDELLTATQREPLDFADLVGGFRKAMHQGTDVHVLAGDPGMLAVAYPPVSDTSTAGDWNKAAAANNRIEIRLRPAR